MTTLQGADCGLRIGAALMIAVATLSAQQQVPAVEELIHLREGHDLIELTVNLPTGHAQDGAVEVNILAAG